MKNVSYSLLLFFTVTLIGCSSSKEHARIHTDSIDRVPTHKVSYGPAGKIIYAEQIPVVTTSANATHNSEEKTEEQKVVKEKTVKPVVAKIGKTVSKISSKAGSNYDFLMEQAKSRSALYKYHEKQMDINEAGNPKTNGLAIAGFATSLVGLFIFGLILGIVAIVFGAVSIKSQRRGFAIAALIIGIVDVIGAFIFAATLI